MVLVRMTGIVTKDSSILDVLLFSDADYCYKCTVYKVSVTKMRHHDKRKLLGFFVAQVLEIFLNFSTGRAERRVSGPALTYDKKQCQKIAL